MVIPAKTKAPQQGRFSCFPVFVFRIIPLAHGRVSPDVDSPQVLRNVLKEVPDCVDNVIVAQPADFAC